MYSALNTIEVEENSATIGMRNSVVTLFEYWQYLALYILYLQVIFTSEIVEVSCYISLHTPTHRNDWN